MPLNIGTKVYRNLQEQVGYLTELVNELKQIIREKEYAIKDIDLVNGELIFTFNDDSEINAGTIKGIESISFNASRHLIVVLNTGEEIDLGQIKGLTSISLNASKHLIVTYDDGTTSDLGLLKGVDHFALDASMHLIVYYDNNTSEDLGAVIQGTIDFSNIDLVAKTLEQTNVNWGADMSVTNRTSITGTRLYCRLQKINTKLSIVFNYKFTNSTGSSVSLESYLAQTFNTIPQEIASKLVDLNNYPLYPNAYGTDVRVLIATAPLQATKTIQPSGILNMPALDVVGSLNIFSRPQYLQIEIVPYLKSDITLNDGESLWVTGRITLDLL